MNLFLMLFSLISSCQDVLALYPRDSLTREVKSLDGIWNFRASPSEDQEIGFRNAWYRRPLKEV